MSELQCPSCGRQLSIGQGAAFCPFCGGSLTKAAQTPDDEAIQKLLSEVDAQSDPVKKHELLTKAQAQYPDSLSIAQEILKQHKGSIRIDSVYGEGTDVRITLPAAEDQH